MALVDELVGYLRRTVWPARIADTGELVALSIELALTVRPERYAEALELAVLAAQAGLRDARDLGLYLDDTGGA